MKKKYCLALFAGLLVFMTIKVDGYEWNAVGSKIYGINSRDYLGQSVSLSGDGEIWAIGIPGNDRNVNNTGSVRFYGRETSGWVEVRPEIFGQLEGEQFGFNVEINYDGTVVAVRSNGDSQVRVFKWVGSYWQQIGGAFPCSSFSLSADGTSIAIGALACELVEDSAGCVKVFKWTGNAWVLKGNPIFGDYSGQSLGSMVALSDDGNLLVALQNNSEMRSGSPVRILGWNGSRWVQNQNPIEGIDQQPTLTRMSLSGNGSVLALASIHSTSLFVLEDSRWNLSTVVNGSSNAMDLDYDGDTFAFGIMPIMGNGGILVYKVTEGQWSSQRLSGYTVSLSLNDNGDILTMGGLALGYHHNEYYRGEALAYSSIPLLGLKNFYECSAGSNTIVDASPLGQDNGDYSYKWYFRPIGGTFGEIPEPFNQRFLSIACGESSEGTWKVEVSSDFATTITTSKSFEFRVFTDSDDDGLSDYNEGQIIGTDPLNNDTDGDGLLDGDEVNSYGSSPLLTDSNLDGYDDGYVVNYGYVPMRSFRNFREYYFNKVKEQIPDVSVTSVLNGSASFELTIESSENLVDWQEYGNVELQIDLDEDIRSPIIYSID
jgi:hypothetical protein